MVEVLDNWQTNILNKLFCSLSANSFKGDLIEMKSYYISNLLAKNLENAKRKMIHDPIKKD